MTSIDPGDPEFPEPYAIDPLPEIRKAVRSSGEKIVVLDDDPTGTQTVRALPVVTCWDMETLRMEMRASGPGFFILTNSRSLNREQSRALHHELCSNLRAAAEGRPCRIISRSDSTLRGHFPLETDVIAEHFGPFDGLILAPFFEAGGRITLGDTHYLREEGGLVPVSETPFARDAAFGFSHASLPAWVEEKTAGCVRREDVCCVPLEASRQGPEAVERVLKDFPTGRVIVVNAACTRDMEVFVAGMMRAEQSGRRYGARTAASFVAACFGQPRHEPLPGSSFHLPQRIGGLVVAGSHVPKTTAQLDALCRENPIRRMEINVPELLDSADESVLVTSLARDISGALNGGTDVLLATSRQVIEGESADSSLEISRRVSRALVEVVRGLTVQPAFLIAKGGITSSDLATHACEVRRARVLGQIIPGVPVWELAPETRFPGMPYVVFPGNVGGDAAVSEALKKLRAG